MRKPNKPRKPVEPKFSSWCKKNKNVSKAKVIENSTGTQCKVGLKEVLKLAKDLDDDFIEKSYIHYQTGQVRWGQGFKRWSLVMEGAREHEELEKEFAKVMERHRVAMDKYEKEMLQYEMDLTSWKKQEIDKAKVAFKRHIESIERRE